MYKPNKGAVDPHRAAHHRRRLQPLPRLRRHPGRRDEGHRGGVRAAARGRGRRLVAHRARAQGAGHRAAAQEPLRRDRDRRGLRAARRDAGRARLRLLPAQQARGVGGVPRPGLRLRARPDAARSSDADAAVARACVLVVEHAGRCPPALVGRHGCDDAGRRPRRAPAVRRRRPARRSRLADGLLVLDGAMATLDDAHRALARAASRTSSGQAAAAGWCTSADLPRDTSALAVALGGAVQAQPARPAVGLSSGWTPVLRRPARPGRSSARRPPSRRVARRRTRRCGGIGRRSTARRRAASWRGAVGGPRRAGALGRPSGASAWLLAERWRAESPATGPSCWRGPSSDRRPRPRARSSTRRRSSREVGRRAAAELGDAWRPLAHRFAALGERGAGRMTSLRVARPPPGDLARLGFHDAERAGAAARAASATPAEPLRRTWSGAAPTPTRRWPRLVELAERGRRPRGCSREVADDEGTAMRLLLRARRQRGARRPPAPPPRALARADRPDAGLHPAARRTPCARRCCAAVGADPADADAGRHAGGRRGAWTRCAWSTAGCCCGSPPATSPTTSASTTSRPSSSDLAAGTLEAALAVARAQVGEAAATCPARGGRDGQVRRPRAQLRQRRRRHLRRRAGRGRRRAAGAARRHPARLAPDAGLLRPHRARARSGRSTPTCGPRASPGRWCGRWPATAATTSGGPRPGSSRRCSRPGRSPATSRSGAAYVEMIGPMVWTAAERDGFVADVQAMRRRVVDHIPAAPGRAAAQARLGRAARRRVRRPAAAAGARPRRRGAALADHAQRAGPSSPRAATSGARTARRCTRPTRSCAPWSTASSCTSCGAPTSSPTTRPSLRRLGRSLGYTKEPVRELDKQWRYHRREVRRLHEKLFYRPLLAAVARIPGEEARLSPGGRAASGWPRSATLDPRPRCGTSRRSPAGSRGPRRSSAPCCR